MSRALIGRNKPLCVLLAVQCGRKKKLGNDVIGSPEAENGNCSEPTADRPAYLVSGGQLEVQFVDRPIVNELKQRLESSRPDIVFFLSDKGPGQETWPLVLGEKDLSIDTLKLLFGAKLPDLVYFEASTTARLANLLHSQGVKHVVGWKDVVGLQVAEHFRQALLAALRSSGCESWDAFVLANASLEMHCSQFRISQAVSSSNLPVIIGDPPAALVDPPKEGNDDGSPTSAPLIQIFDEETELRLLVCAEACSTNDKPLEMVEAGLAALLAIEVRRIKLIHRISAPPPPSAAATFARGVVTMRCDLCTSSSARISLVVSGSAQTCFADQFLESTIRKELMEKSQLLRLVTAVNDSKPVELRRSVSIACGAAVLELKFKVPNWAAQTMRQLSTDATYKSLVALGIAGIEGSPVASFQKDDAERLASLNVDKSRAATSAAAADSHRNGICEMPIVPPWFAPAAPTRKRQNLCLSSSASNKAQTSKSGSVFLAAMKPIPHATRRKLMPFAGVVSAGAQDKWSMKLNGNTKSSSSAATTTATTTTTSTAPPAATATAAAAHHNNHNHNHHNHHHPRSTAHAFPIVLPEVKKHNCNRPPILECPEEEFLSDVVQFLVSRGHGRLIPPTGIDSFPDVVLNGKRLDLYNLYREVVSRGGFRVGNGINWKGQIFSKMRNHTTTNRMTGVGNTLKKHYETYLLEYELAHEDVDGECCILCHSSAEGDWVNCGICGEWAHFGCDRRSGLATFKEYAKTDGLEYICPRCSVGGRGGGGGGGGGGGSGGGGRKKQRVVANEGLSNSFPVGKRS